MEAFMLRNFFAVAVAATLFFSPIFSPSSLAGTTPSFEDYIVPVSMVSELEYATVEEGTAAWAFRDSIEHGVIGKQINFGGKFTFVTIDIVSKKLPEYSPAKRYQINFIVDRETGDVYKAPNSYTGYKFQGNSTLLVINSSSCDGKKVPSYASCQHFAWDEETKSFVYLKDGRKIKRTIAQALN